ncbi:MAG: iduronate 2-sulfatase, partial [Chlamydiales bacterium]
MRAGKRMLQTGRSHVPLLIAAVLAAVLVQCTLQPDVETASAKPNVLFISIDDLRPELECYGAERMHTPNLDSFAASSLRFTRAYCQQALCNPSRSSYLTGARPETTRIQGQKEVFRDTMPDVVTLPQHFKANGYTCLSMGKVFHGNRLDARSWSEEEYLPDRKLIYAGEENRTLNRPRKKARVTESEDVADNVYRDGLVADRAIEALERLKDEPFFLALGFFKPHLPFAAPKRYWDMYPPGSIELPKDMSAPLGAVIFGMHDSHEIRQYMDAPDSGAFSDEFMLRLLHGYLACTSYVDAQVGRVLDALPGLGLSDNTIVVIFGDHGFYLGDHGMWGKSGTFETAARVPLMIRAPGKSKGGSTSAALVELVDLYPSLCELAGLPLPTHLEGLSFAPLLSDPAQSWKKAAFTYHPSGPVEGASLCNDRWRFTSWRTLGPGGKEVSRELYDHESDPLEM